VRKIRVLENPYDIASFYRSHQGEGDYFGLQAVGTGERYPIAGFYRQNGGRGYGYSQFWTSGYSGRSRRGLTLGYRRRIGDNGDIYLLAPFLASVFPGTDAASANGPPFVRDATASPTAPKIAGAYRLRFLGFAFPPFFGLICASGRAGAFSSFPRAASKSALLTFIALVEHP